MSRIRQGLAKTRSGFVAGVRSLLRGRSLSAELLKDLEARMIQADIGVKTSRALVHGLRAAWESGRVVDGDQALEYLKTQLRSFYPEEDRALHFAAPGSGPTVILVTGINGAGKTTSIAKLAKRLKDQGRSVMLAAGDTFRAAAVEQLEVWSRRLGVELVKGQQGGDPAAVVFDACEAALARKIDVLIVDTAGRLHTQDHLMRQLAKIRGVIAKKIPVPDGERPVPQEVLLVLDATVGQNAVNQARVFTEACDVTGLFLAKLDGSAKGGSVIAIRQQLGVPVKFVGLGETPDDIEPFDPDRFIEAMFAEPDEDA